ncbi:MAG TPA: hypothetical protein VJR46_10995 [Candidatus Dormibacteraeota bacterium]|nr:hypothetical protein [Candidatus Dormibacteraeota bacterium]
MSTYLEVVFRSKFRLLALILVLPVVFAAVDLYLWRSYTASEVVWVPDPGSYNQNLNTYLGFDQFATPSQNFARLFSNLLGVANFNAALMSKLDSEGAFESAHDRSAVSASLNQIGVAPGRASGSGAAAGGGGGGAALGDHVVTARYTCSRRALCVSVLTSVLSVFVSTYIDLKTKAANDSRAIYLSQLATDQAQVKSIQAQIESYIKSHPSQRNQSQQSDPILSGLQHQLDQSQKAVDADNAQILSIDTLLHQVSAMLADVTVIDGPALQGGLLGLSGVGSDNLKTDAIAFAGCLVAAVIYVMLVAFTDRTIRDPNVVKNRLRVKVIPIPDYQQKRSRRQRGAVLE